MPESKEHLKKRYLLFDILEHAIAHEACIGADQFVYWNAADPRRALAPDVFVRLRVPDAVFKTWKTWERGAPELAVELVSDDDRPERAWEEKLQRYHELGVLELIRFDDEAHPGERLRAWDRIDERLVERVVRSDTTVCATLSLYWVVRPLGPYGPALRLARDAEGRDLLPTPAEAEAREREKADRARDSAERARESADRARESAERDAQAAQRRIAELEAELRRRK